MRFLRRPRQESRSIAVFCGAFHPPTIAHMALVEAAKAQVDEVIWVLPESFPHKTYDQVSLEDRAAMLLQVGSDPVAIAENNLFFEVAQEALEHLPGSEVKLLIGEDGARRFIEWDYGFTEDQHIAYLEQWLQRFPVVTAKRQESWQLPESLEAYFRWLSLDERVQAISSSLVRERILLGENWSGLVPVEIHALVDQLYGSKGRASGQ
jgi:nicotinate-nucleotide adenylyltransferase